MSNYLGWDELDDDLPAVGPVLDDPVREQLAVLMRERSRLEEQLMRLLGKAEPRPEDLREQARFPMPIHTAESRLEDRRRMREEERAAAAARRALEATRIAADEARRRSEQQKDLERAMIQRRALELAEARLAKERQEDRARRTLADELIHLRWDEQRAAARRATAEARRQEWVRFEQQAERNRVAASDRYHARRRDDAEFEEHLAQRAERTSRRRASATSAGSPR